MTENRIVDAITNMDSDMIEEYLAMKKEILSARKTSNRIKAHWKGWATLAACFVLLLSGVLTVLIRNRPDDGGVQTPDALYNFGLGELCEQESWNGSYHSIVFNHVYLTEETNGQKGYYLIFEGNIHTPSFHFRTADIFLALRMIKAPDYITQNKAELDVELSQAISEIDLLFDGESGEMNGQFCLVFSIDEQNFALIKSKSPQTSFENNSGTQITLGAGVYWSGGRTDFVFSTTDVQYVEKMNKG